MPLPKAFNSFAEFEREILRPNNRLGLTVEEMVDDPTFEAELDFDKDPFSAAEADDDDY